MKRRGLLGMLGIAAAAPGAALAGADRLRGFASGGLVQGSAGIARLGSLSRPFTPEQLAAAFHGPGTIELKFGSVAETPEAFEAELANRFRA
jgi:hypothetical protein